MNINENQEFETINQKTSERNANAMVECHSTEEIYRAKNIKAKRRALICIFVTFSITLVVAASIFGLEYIGWINATFKIVLLCLTGCVAMFKTGYFWREIAK